MTKLVIHIGPGKCGSTSIQRFLSASISRAQGDACNTCYIEVPRSVVEHLEKSNLKESAATDVLGRIEGALENFDTVVVSHESLFRRHGALFHIFDLAEKAGVVRPLIIGYSRQQSAWMEAAYSEWLFRNKSRLKTDCMILSQYGISPSSFMAVERRLIATALRDFGLKTESPPSRYRIYNWEESYLPIRAIAESYRADLRVGVLPTAKSPHSLTMDFVLKAELDVSLPVVDQRHNLRFQSDLVEAMADATLVGESTQSPNVENWKLHSLSDRLPPAEPYAPGFRNYLKKQIDYLYAGSNKGFCDAFDLDANYFQLGTPPSKTEYIDRIMTEEGRRRESPTELNDYKERLSHVFQSWIKFDNTAKRHSSIIAATSAN